MHFFWRKNGPLPENPEHLFSSPQLTDIVDLPRNGTDLNYSVLHQKYTLEKASMRQIAKEFLCSKTAVRNALITAGIPLRRRSHPGFSSAVAYGTTIKRGRRVADGVEQKVIETIGSLRKDGMSFEKIAQCLTKLGIPTKTRRRKWNCGCVRVIYLKHCT